MKILKYIFLGSLLSVLAVSCEKGIDPINPVAPGTDNYAPDITINYPLEGTLVRVPDEIATINIKVVVTDDIELKKVVFQMDGAEIASFTSFKDYRRAMIDYAYNNVTDGEHTLTVIATDLTDKSKSKSVNFKKVAPYTPLDGEVFYMPFDGDYTDLVSVVPATVTGAPGFADGKAGQAYAGAKDAYLKFPTANILGNEFSVSFWYKINADPDRAGILAISAPGEDRSTGFRLFREKSGDKQNIGLNFGIGTTEVWMNPFIQVPTNEGWMHIAISISTSKATIYVNGQPAPSNSQADLAGNIVWTGCNSMTIGSGMPNFVYWEHFSDKSLYDELRIFNKALSAAEVQNLYNGKK